MCIERRQPGDEDAAAACYDVWRAAQRVDDPGGPPWSPRFFGAWLEHGYEGHPGELWLVPGDSGASGHSGADAWCRVGLPDQEDLTVATVELVVRPRARRRGLGTRLLRHAAARASAHGRTLLAADIRENSAGQAFAEGIKAARGHTTVRRVLDLSALPPGHLARLRDRTAPHTAGYSFVRWLGDTPACYRGRVAAVYEAMNDAPREPGREAVAWDADRGIVSITAVTAPHRGRRLGLGVKIAAQEWAAEAEPALRWIETGNAAVNRHMIAVNEALGYRIHGPGTISYEIAAGDVPG